jgi:hypothetical protein
MPPSGNLFFTDGDDERSIKPKRLNRRASSGGQPGQTRPLPLEVQMPVIPPRIEERSLRSSSRVDGGFAGAFSEGARDACQSQVRQFSHAAGNDRDDMIHVKDCFLPGLGKLAILATKLSSFPDLAAKQLRDVHPEQPCLLTAETLGAHLQQREQFNKIHQTLRFLALCFTKRFATILTIQQLLKARLHSFRHVKPCKVIGYFHFQLDCVAHSG